jgi:hypothetical protein
MEKFREKTYKVVDPSGEKLGQLHNWAVYSSGGEYTREAFGLTLPSSTFLLGKSFFERYMKPQLVHFTKEGMYRDPNDPITYDITTRLQIANPLAYGYNPLNEKFIHETRTSSRNSSSFVLRILFNPSGPSKRFPAG